MAASSEIMNVISDPLSPAPTHTTRLPLNGSAPLYCIEWMISPLNLSCPGQVGFTGICALAKRAASKKRSEDKTSHMSEKAWQAATVEGALRVYFAANSSIGQKELTPTTHPRSTASNRTVLFPCDPRS